MRKFLSVSLIVAGVAGLMSVLAATSTWADVVGSKHDLNADPDLTIAGTDEVCVFCHTPHNANTTRGPLWNRNAAATTTFSMYSSSTIDGTQQSQPAGVSLACLSCHDGATAFDALVNGGAIAVTMTAGGATATMTTLNSGNAILGSDLSNDHPISIQYGQPPAEFNVASSGKVGALPLFGAGADQVECASCHNPHDTTNGKFLRMSNSSSALCLTCHIK